MPYKMKIQEIIIELNKSKSKGFQLTKRNGILTFTRLIYKKKEHFYYFDINQKIEFVNDYKYSEEELLEEFKNVNFEIDLSIN